ncbi:LemA family protein [Balneolaceae bacterium ANBcel3]|nr:LemA family protein [Balneolaceae bacterium ANBcel3]
METNTMLIIAFVVILIVGLILLIRIPIRIYNKLVELRNMFKNAFAQIDVQLKRRYDIVPNLVETTKAYLKHESGTLEAVIKARNQAQQLESRVAEDPGNADLMKKFAGAESQLSGALGRLFAISESYPELKANQNVMQLFDELTVIEQHIASARALFNNAVTTYNIGREIFPNIILANIMGFAPAELFEITNEEEREAPRVQFS